MTACQKKRWRNAYKKAFKKSREILFENLDIRLWRDYAIITNKWTL